jgi:hypothetical protein
LGIGLNPGEDQHNSHGASSKGRIEALREYLEKKVCGKVDLGESAIGIKISATESRLVTKEFRQ